ncbi:2-dehydro-3-deoxy-D-gluconate 5-dehydrogenase [subsurface metagenome]
MKKYSDVTYDFSGKVALITGATSGIFQAVAKGYGAAGAAVALTRNVNKDGAEETKSAIEKSGGTAKVYQCDVANVPQIVSTVKQVISDFGKIDVLITGAGNQYRSKAEEFPEDKWDSVMDVHCKGSYFMCREVGRHMIERGEGGKIINCSSLLAFSGGLTVPAYAAAKGAVTQFTKALCNEWAKYNINVNAIAPGYYLTRITQPLADDPVRNEGILSRLPVGKWGDCEDIVGSFLFLGSQASDYIHGTILTVDGGWMAR